MICSKYISYIRQRKFAITLCSKLYCLNALFVSHCDYLNINYILRTRYNFYILYNVRKMLQLVIFKMTYIVKISNKIPKKFLSNNKAKRAIFTNVENQRINLEFEKLYRFKATSTFSMMTLITVKL